MSTPISQIPSAGATLSSLQTTAGQLWSIVQSPPNAGVQAAASIEYRAVQDRISTLLGLQLDKDTADLLNQSNNIKTATTALVAALATVTKASDIINKVASYLKTIDTFITTAKGLAVALLAVGKVTASVKRRK